MVYGPIDGKMTKLEYDCRNRLIKAGDITYEYDAEGNRIATNTPEYREEYIYDTVSNLPQVLVIKRYDVKDDESSSIVCYYGNGLLYEDNDKGTYFHHYNNIGSTILLTNSSGKIVEEYSYGTYGELLSGDTSKTKYLYNGQYGIQTELNGLLYMRTRYYNPEIKRFINQDTVLGSITNSQSLNRYAYVQGNPISLVDPFGMSPENGKNALGHAILDVMGLIPVAGAICDVANCVWYILDDNYAMAAISAFAAIPGLGDLASAGKLATKGAKAAELCKIIKKLGYAAKVAENVGEIAINATNMYVDYAIKEKEFGVDTVASLLAAGLNGFGIYASVKRYNSISLDSPSVNTGKVTEEVEGGNKVAEKVSESGSKGSLDTGLLDELANSGVKYNPDDVVTVMKNSDGKIMWLENGNSKAGLTHILERHADDFAAQGVSDIPKLLENVLSTNPIKTGSNAKGLFADYILNGNSYRVAYGTNGFVVSFYPID